MMSRGVLLLAILGGFLAAAADRELAGKVVDANSGEPVGHARLTLHFYQGGQQAAEVTLLSDTDGSFKVTNMPEGGYQISADKAGYLTANQGMGPANPSDGKSTQTLLLKLTAQAALEGIVLDDKDMPSDNTFIQLVRQQVMNGKKQYQLTMGGGTDETGHFRLFGLQAGRYYVGIAARVSGMRRSKPVAYPALFYPNAMEIAAAQPIDLKAGDNLEIRVRLPEPVAAREIRGVVAGGGTYVNVMLARQPASLSPLPPTTDNNWDAKTRSFRISHVTPGMYLLTAHSQDGKVSLQANTMVTVGNADIGGLRLELAETAIDGTVRVEGNPVQGRPMGYVSFQSQRSANGAGASVDADGKFHATNLAPDTYRVMPQINGSMCVRSILQGGREVRDGVAVTTEGATAPVEIVLTNHCGTIEATVTPSDSMPSNLMGVLLRKAGDEFVMEKQAYIGGRTGEAAPRFVMQGVSPGDYMLYVWQQDSQIEYANAEYMRQFESYGAAVTATEDGKVSATIDKVLVSTGKN